MTTAFLRTVILYVALMVGLRLMGKRQIGELEPSGLVLTLIIADLAAVPMQDFGIPLINGLLPIAVMLSLSLLFSFFSLKSIRFRGLLCGRPAIIIREGKPMQRAMAKNRFTVDELFEELRTQGVTDISSVKYAILETNGELSVLPYPDPAPSPPTLPMLVINDGRVIQHNLKSSGHDVSWLMKQLKKQRLSSPRQVFLMTVDEEGAILCIPKEARR